MNDGMKIILERLKTHPEEFESLDNPFATESKWTNLIHRYERNLPKEDLEAFKKAIDDIRQAEFTAKVMEELLDPKEEVQLSLNPYANTANVTLSAGTTLGTWANTGTTTTTLTANSLTLGKTTVTDTQLHELLHMKAQIELGRQKEKKSKTLFGRLFNYS